jgi:cytochrome c biogenesis protein ResB
MRGKNKTGIREKRDELPRRTQVSPEKEIAMKVSFLLERERERERQRESKNRAKRTGFNRAGGYFFHVGLW